MQMASSAKRTCSELRSASLYTATALIPSSLQAQMTRSAISPRFAIRIFLNMDERVVLPLSDGEKRLAVFHRLPVLDQFLDDLAAGVGLDLVHQLHRLHDAQHLSGLYVVSRLHEWRGPRGRRIVERPYDGRLHQVQPLFGGGFLRDWRRCRGH